MDEITFVNAGYNVAEPPNIHFHYTTPRHLFLYFQSDVNISGKVEKSGSCIIYTKDSLRDYKSMDNFINSYISFTAPLEFFSKLGIKTNKVIHPENCSDINDIIFKICSENSNRERGFEEKFQSLILDLLVTISRGTNQAHAHKELDLKNKMNTIRTAFCPTLFLPLISTLCFMTKAFPEPRAIKCTPSFSTHPPRKI